MFFDIDSNIGMAFQPWLNSLVGKYPIPFHWLKEDWYYMPAPKKITHTDVVTESTKLDATTSVDPELQKALCNEEDGFMRPGAMPSVTAASAAGTKTLLEAVAKAR